MAEKKFCGLINIPKFIFIESINDSINNRCINTPDIDHQLFFQTGQGYQPRVIKALPPPTAKHEKKVEGREYLSVTFCLHFSHNDNICYSSLENLPSNALKCPSPVFRRTNDTLNERRIAARNSGN